MSKSKFLSAFIFLSGLSGISSVVAQEQNAIARRPPVNVTVAAARLESLPFRIEAIGSIQPMASVQLRARVDAQIERIEVADGAQVAAGDTLVKLDSRQVEAQLKQAQAQLARDKAALQQNERDVARYNQLLASKAGTQVNLDNSKTAVLATQAAIEGDEAAIESLKVQLTYYTLRAPISGAIGAFSLKAGNLARANDNTATGVLATIHQISPIYAVFSVPQRYLPDLRAAMARGGALTLVKPQGGRDWVEGKVALIDNMIDAATGMLLVRAIFPNKDEALWPGQLCDVKVTLRVDDNLVVVPREAVQVGQRGNFVFVDDNGVARLRDVKITREQDGQTVISEGVSVGESLVVMGANMLANGAPIVAAKPSAGKAGEKPGS